MYEQLISYLNGFLKLSDKAAQEVRKNFRVQKIPKDQFISSAGEIANEVHFVAKGCFRYFHKDGNKAITYWFEFENFFATSIRSFTKRQPSQEYIQAIENSMVLSITSDDLMTLYDKYHEFERLGRLITEQYASRLQNRIVGLQISGASQRYLHLMKTQPQVIQRVPLGYVSSYLGISQETLSRIRANI